MFKKMNSKNPRDCSSAEEIRTEIDRIDREIFELFAKRHEFVEEIVKFKTDIAAVVAKERKEMVIQQRKGWAKELGLNPTTFESIYKLLIDSNIEHELNLLKAKYSSSK
jgi:isochorismate pyruvate lyase